MACALCAAVAAFIVSGCGRDDTISQAERSASSRPRISETKAIFEDGFVYGLPIVMSYEAMYKQAIDRDSGQFKAPLNRIYNSTHVATPQDTAFVTPNSDAPYSYLWMDLRAEPVVISVPNVEKKRYFTVQLCDSNTFNYGYFGSRTTGTRAGDFLVAGPDWKGDKPVGVKKVFRSSTQFSLALFRTQLFDPEDMPNVKKVQAGYKARPLSKYLGTKRPPAAPPIDWPKIDDDLIKANFFSYLGFMLQFAPPGPEEHDIRAELARIGIVAGRSFDADNLSVTHRAEMKKAMKDGNDKITQYLQTGVANINGWRLSAFFGDREFFSGDWLKRAAGARAGLFGNDAVEAVYPATKTTADDDALDGGKHTYTITFAKDQLPPVRAFWSLTMYDLKTQLLVANPIDRYLINSAMLPQLKNNADGSLTIYIQKDAPVKEKKSNWLPAPDGTFGIAMRLYWPRTDPPSILPPGKGTWRPPAIVQTD